LINIYVSLTILSIDYCDREENYQREITSGHCCF